MLLAVASALADGPAVSGPNGKVSIDGGEIGYEEWFKATGGYAMPLGHAFGAVIEAGAGNINNEPGFDGALHLFTRDPSRYLLGLYAWYYDSKSFKDLRTAAQFELYLDRITFSGLAGYEDMEVATNGSSVANSFNGHFFGVADLAYFATNNLKLAGGYRYVYEMSFATASAEYLFPGDGDGAPIAIYVYAHMGDSAYQRVVGGFKVFLGAEPEKALIDRLRKDLVGVDP